MSRESIEADQPIQPDADHFADRLESLHRTLEGSAEGLEIELYHRVAFTLRASRRPGATITAIQHGREEGLAVRSRFGSSGRVAFAASSGSDATSGRWALERCRRAADEGRDDGESWPGRMTALRVDRDDSAELPPAGELTAWMAAASERLMEPGAGTGRWGTPLESRVEVAATVETWVAAAGLRASRARARVWALVRPRGQDAQGSLPKKVMIARRRWTDLPTDGWRSILEDRLAASSPEGKCPDGRVPVLFNPECSAILVSALARVLHTPGDDEAIEVGPAWQLIDDPMDPDALFGGSFDDAGFTTRRRILADGARTTGRLVSKGHLRRPSFRDRPVPMASQLVIRADPGNPPSHGVLVTGLTLHPTSPDHWLLGVDGALLDGGLPGATLTRAFIAVSPEDLVRRCVAAVGPARPSYLGVITPALVFDGLPIVRGDVFQTPVLGTG